MRKQETVRALPLVFLCFGFTVTKDFGVVVRVRNGVTAESHFHSFADVSVKIVLFFFRSRNANA